MSIFKKKKSRILLISLSVGIVASVSSGALIYNASSDNSLSKLLFSSESDSLLHPSNSVDYSKTVNSITDKNVKELSKQPKVIEKPVEKIEKITPPKIEVKPEEPAATPEPPRITPEIPNYKPDVTSLIQRTEKIRIFGVEVNATVLARPDRVVSEADKKREITNVNPYQNVTVSKLLNIEVTKDLENKVIENALGSEEGQGLGLFSNNLFKIADSIGTKEGLEKAEVVLVKQNPGTWSEQIHRYKALINSGKFKDFLKEGKLEEYERLVKENSFKTANQKYLWIIINLDKSKFTKISQNSLNYLKQGLAIDPRNAIINANGEIDSLVWNVPNQYNTVTSRLSRDNSTRRAFDYDEWYLRSSDSIVKGKFPGWTRSDKTSEYQSAYGIQPSDGIKVFELTRDKPVNDGSKRNSGIVVEIDAANSSGYNKIKELIEKFKANNKEITSYRIFNMGVTSPSQEFKDILKSLPDKLPQLELFFSAQATNTSSLIALKDKNIKELSLYTMGNSLLDSWSFNPWSLNKVEWINTNDYNVSAQYPPNTPIATRISFDTVAFDQEDYSKVGDWERINNGLRMVYFVRNNEPFFQGRHGSGTEPDSSESGNSYPTGLDFSRVPTIKSLRGLVFHDIEKPNNGSRKIKRLTLANSGDSFEISSDELSAAGLENLAIGEPEQPKIFFSNGQQTKAIKIKLENGKKQLDNSAIENLRKFYAYSDSLKAGGKSIKVDSNATELKQQLIGLGYKVEDDNGLQYT
ncbi:putative immunoglobulin-blocking virulence protein [Mycoplasmopsis bovis]|uniref:putative immunoglobulin-blocking virulence protein n=1 Tax=Mycoplasmopsis bovis TaxID=28903 RepID=UPI00176745E7|nr:putative immunoglobulin-blocking virulence protein [Mycoplasmopsis bovis]MBT1315952.1 putative immunoglobulin-blocking virulence protein [Mycoplasmopsis bovis]MBT1319791.1 putative immunoglobulin-blocking virulence protein [Mycoplasmopsis bovis]MBT1328224.1 putative immunoglobulin-blocking virulence protein [Mycoplasmopsis bovis]MBT1332747.1 putative immunoglobulin-blocking virulence protein [Mycoplasmopsis bovis]MBT1367468.1 putative immunoglobulin-blocking virulence protein [Mycoplasmopsi